MRIICIDQVRKTTKIMTKLVVVIQQIANPDWPKMLLFHNTFHEHENKFKPFQYIQYLPGGNGGQRRIFFWITAEFFTRNLLSTMIQVL